MKKFDAVFTQRHAEDGLTRGEVMDLLAHLKLSDGEDIFPLVIDGNNARAYGFIRNEAVSHTLGDDIGDHSPFVRDLLAVVNDMTLEHADRLYNFAGVRTLMYY